MLAPLLVLLMLVQSLVVQARECAEGECRASAEAECAIIDAAVHALEEAPSIPCADPSSGAARDDQGRTCHDEHRDGASSDCASSGCARLCSCCPVLAPVAPRAALGHAIAEAPLSFPPAPVRTPLALAASIDHPPCRTI